MNIELFKAVIMALRNLEKDELVNVHNKCYASTPNMIIHRMDDFNSITSNMSRLEVARYVAYGDFYDEDKYFVIGYDRIDSFTSVYERESLIDINSLARNIVDKNDCFDNDKIKEVLLMYS